MPDSIKQIISSLQDEIDSLRGDLRRAYARIDELENREWRRKQAEKGTTFRQYNIARARTDVVFQRPYFTVTYFRN